MRHATSPRTCCLSADDLPSPHSLGLLHLQRVDQEQLGNNDGDSLKVYCLPAIVLEIVQLEHGRVNQLRDLRHDPLEVREEGRVVERPF
jgi:hypothetical protein